MANSATKPPDEGPAPEGDELDETEMTSIMDADQRRELQRAARALKEPDRETARPPPEAAIAVEAEAAIPKAAAVPAEALALPESTPEPASEPEPEPTAPPARKAAAAGTPAPSGLNVWWVISFVLLAAAIVFEMR